MHAQGSTAVTGGEQPDNPNPPVLVVMPDGDTRVDPAHKILGHPPLARLARAAQRAGFGELIAAPGTRLLAETADVFVEHATGDAIERPALVTFETSYLDPALLALMVEHPLEPDEQFSLYDPLGRPIAWFTGKLARVVAAVPLSEEIPWPEGFGPHRLGRVITTEDLPRVEQLILDCELRAPLGRSLWVHHIDMPLMRTFASRIQPTAQLELLAVVCSVGSGALALVGGTVGLVLAAWSLLVGVEIARVLPAVGRLREFRFSPGDLVPSAVVRPFGHAALTAALTYVLVAEPTRSSVAGLVLLCVGAAAVLLTLAHARVLLRRQTNEVGFALPRPEALASRLGLTFPERLSVPLRLEVLGLVLALTAMPELVWGLMVAAGLARLWRWFVAPAKTDVLPAIDQQRSDAQSPQWDRSAIDTVERAP